MLKFSISTIVVSLLCIIVNGYIKHNSIYKKADVFTAGALYSNVEPTTEVQALKKSYGSIVFAAIASTLIATRSARAGLFQSDQQDSIDEISKFQKPVAELLQQLKPTLLPNAIGVFSVTQTLRATKEDANVVETYLEVYIKPLQRKMKLVAPTLALEKEAQERIEVLPSLMLGHSLELKQAIDSLNVEAEVREVEEVQETLIEFLKLASNKYKVPQFSLGRPLTDAELFGPLGCEFWGKKRVEGSNACAEVK